MTDHGSGGGVMAQRWAIDAPPDPQSGSSVNTAGPCRPAPQR